MPINRVHLAEIYDMTDFLSAGELPRDNTTGRPLIQRLMECNNRDVWRTRAEPVDVTKPDRPIDWALSRNVTLVRIPLIPYRTSQNQAEALLGAMHIIQRCVEAVPEAIKTIIILGTPIEDMRDHGETGFRFWLGFAAQLQ